MLLPLASEPFTALGDRDMLLSERWELVRTHRTCAFGHRRRHDGPAMSVVFCIPADDDELLVSAMAGRGKRCVVQRDGEVGRCVLDGRWPCACVQVYADAVIERGRDLVIDVTMPVIGRMSGQPMGGEARPFVEAMAKEEPVVIHCRPCATSASPPRHLQSNDQKEEISRWLSGSVPWGAADHA